MHALWKPCTCKISLLVLACLYGSALMVICGCTYSECMSGALGNKNLHDAPAGVVEAVAAAKRALSSHPLPDPFQPSG